MQYRSSHSSHSRSLVERCLVSSGSGSLLRAISFTLYAAISFVMRSSMLSSRAMSCWKLVVALGLCWASYLSVSRSKVIFRKLVRKEGANRALAHEEKRDVGIVVFTVRFSFFGSGYVGRVNLVQVIIYEKRKSHVLLKVTIWI